MPWRICLAWIAGGAAGAVILFGHGPARMFETAFVADQTAPGPLLQALGLMMGLALVSAAAIPGAFKAKARPGKTWMWVPLGIPFAVMGRAVLGGLVTRRGAILRGTIATLPVVRRTGMRRTGMRRA